MASYTLYVYDTPLAGFEFSCEQRVENPAGGDDLLSRLRERKQTPHRTVNLLWVEPGTSHLLPLELLDLTQDPPLDRFDGLERRLARWLAGRLPPSNRQFIRNVLDACGLRGDDPGELADFCMMLSLSDSYRVVNDDCPFVPFAQCNLFDNRFDEVLTLAAYTGITNSGKRRWAGSAGGLRSTPELTTGGMLPKAWRWIRDGIVLYKGGTTGYANAGLEPYSEFYAAQAAARMGLDAVSYGLERWHGILASTCRLFTSRDISFVPAYALMEAFGEPGENSLERCAAAYDRFGMLERFGDMLLFDAVVCNEDRHYANFGVMRDNRTGTIIGPAPIFDNGASLFPHAMKDDLKDINRYAATRRPAYPGFTFDDIAELTMDGRRKAMLRRLIGFEFAKHPRYNLPAYRLKAITAALHERVGRFLQCRTHVQGVGMKHTQHERSPAVEENYDMPER